MTALLLCFFLTHLGLPETADYFWDRRHLVCLNIALDTPPMPSALVDARCPPLRLIHRPLPVARYRQADRERNRRLYGEDTVRLDPTLIVLHFTVVDDTEAVMNIFSRPSNLMIGNQGSVTSLVSVHYMVDKDGSVIALVPEDRRTTGSYGVDHRALAIEMVARDQEDLLSRPRQLLAAFCLIDGLLKKHDLPVWSVVSHQEVAYGKLYLSDYTDLADTEYPYFYPKPQFRYDPGPVTMAWCREFLLRQRGLWHLHPARARMPSMTAPPPSNTTREQDSPPNPFEGLLIKRPPR